jgi:CheY-like chemotaxis protein
MLRHTLPKAIEVHVETGEELWPAPVDATQFTQVLMNLCVNARDAMPHGGRLTVRAENLAVDEQYARMRPEARPGRYVAVAVSDTGTGMPPEVLEHIFDPFFTTKELGKGTGLGLSTALGIVKGHGGFVNVYSEVGTGSRFVACFPAAGEASAVRPPSASPAMLGRGELILVVDDESAIAQIARQTLEAHGYRVLTAANGAEAVELFAAHRGEVRAVLTDMMMPVLDGAATIRALRALDPGVRVIAANGLATARPASSPEVAAALPKPYTAAALLETLRLVLAKS